MTQKKHLEPQMNADKRRSSFWNSLAYGFLFLFVSMTFFGLGIIYGIFKAAIQSAQNQGPIDSSLVSESFLSGWSMGSTYLGIGTVALVFYIALGVYRNLKPVQEKPSAETSDGH